MKNLSIRSKLTLLGGIPMFGALLLAIQIVSDARAQVQKNESLGTIEHVAQLSEAMGRLVDELQLERAFAARLQGHVAATEGAPSSEGELDELAAPVAPRADQRGARRQEFNAQVERANRARDALAGLIGRYDLNKLPARLAVDVREVTAALQGLAAHRGAVASSSLGLDRTVERYERLVRSLVGGIAALSELTDNGELLRLTTSLVSVLQLKERASREHALLAYVFELGTFPPGSYRELVTLVTEESIFFDAFKTTASQDQGELFERLVTSEAIAPALKLRALAIEATDERLDNRASDWMRVQREKLARIGTVEHELHGRVGAVALQRIRETNRAQWGSAALVIAVILTSTLLAWGIARGITRRVTGLRSVAAEVGGGNLEARVLEAGGDELGALGEAFNDMIGELARARIALGDKIRMARELEIAATLQRAILPPEPTHPEFDFAGRMLPADEVGGDFYDVLRDPNQDTMWITIGDVSGHGIDAGLVMLMTQSAIASQFHASADTKPGITLRNVNRLLCENITERLKDRKYVTAQMYSYRGNGRFVFAGAHQPAIVYRAQTRRCELLEVNGAWLGIDPSIPELEEGTLELEEGDVLCLYTDGLPEARNHEGDLFDIERFVGAVEDAVTRFSDLDDATAAIFAAVGAHTSTRDDDWTILLMRRRFAA